MTTLRNFGDVLRLAFTGRSLADMAVILVPLALLAAAFVWHEWRKERAADRFVRRHYRL